MHQQISLVTNDELRLTYVQDNTDAYNQGLFAWDIQKLAIMVANLWRHWCYHRFSPLISDYQLLEQLPEILYVSGVDNYCSYHMDKILVDLDIHLQERKHSKGILFNVKEIRYENNESLTFAHAITASVVTIVINCFPEQSLCW